MEPEDFLTPPAPRQTLRLRATLPLDLDRAADLLRQGGIVAFPTETVYGLGANALDDPAVSSIFVAKQRPAWDPLIVHIASRSMLDQVADLASPHPFGPLQLTAERLMTAFWPGPLTLLLPRSSHISDAVTAGRPRVGVRMPAHPVALALIAAAGIPIAAPSANLFSHTSPTTAQHVLDDLDGRIDAVLDGGPASIGVESTVLDICESPMRIYRPGAVTQDQIVAVAGPVFGTPVELFRPVLAFALPQAAGLPSPGLPSPGLALRHYAPTATLRLVAGEAELRSIAADQDTARPIGVMLPTGWNADPAAIRFDWGPWQQPEILAQRLFAGLRALDQQTVATILCPLPADTGGLSTALRDRLRKAARSA